MNKILKFIKCKIFQHHNWTCKAMEGIKPEPPKSIDDIGKNFREYTKMYCKDCGYESKLNNW